MAKNLNKDGSISYSDVGNALETGTSLTNNMISASLIKDTKELENSIRSSAKSYYKGMTFDDLDKDWTDFSLIQHVNADDLLGGGNTALNAITSGLLGAAGGASLGPIGAGVGAAVGLGTSLIGSLVARARANREADRLNDVVDYLNDFNRRSLSNNLTNILDSKYSNMLSSYAADGGSINIKPSKRGTFTAAASKHNMGVQEFANKVLSNKENYSPAMIKKANFARNASKWHHAFGGDLLTHGANFDDGFTYIGNGGTHEENPNEGVLMGVAPDGKPNLVEEGEVVWNDYVFSDRLKHPKTGKSFAKEALKASKESEERPNDPISRNGKEDALFKLEELLELIREKKEMKKNKYAKGGHLHSDGDFIFNESELGPTGALDYDIEGNLVSINKASKSKKSKIDWSDIGANLMRGMSTIPALMGLSNPPEVGTMSIPNVREVGASTLSLRLKYNPFDINYTANLLRSTGASTRRAITNTSAGNRGALMAGLLSSGYNELLALGQAYRLAMEYNDAQREKVATFNRGTDLANAEMRLKASIANQQRDEALAKMAMTAQEYNQALKDALYNSKMGNWQNLFSNLANIGTDILNRRDARKTADAKNVSADDLLAVLKATGIIKAKGGRINKRRRGLTY